MKAFIYLFPFTLTVRILLHPLFLFYSVSLIAFCEMRDMNK